MFILIGRWSSSEPLLGDLIDESTRESRLLHTVGPPDLTRCHVSRICGKTARRDDMFNEGA